MTPRAQIRDQARQLADQLATLDPDDRIDALNEVRALLHEVSPMRDEPVDLVQWVPADDVEGNAWNPNTVAAPEMQLLEKSIDADGYTQPIVAFTLPDQDGHREVVDGYHRHLVGKTNTTIRARLRGRLPIVAIRDTQNAEDDRQAATIRHNRARGKHGVQSMAQLVSDLWRRHSGPRKDPVPWLQENLGMQEQEIRTLMMAGGLGKAYAHEDYSRAWHIEHRDAYDEIHEPREPGEPGNGAIP